LGDDEAKVRELVVAQELWVKLIGRYQIGAGDSGIALLAGVLNDVRALGREEGTRAEREAILALAGQFKHADHDEAWHRDWADFMRTIAARGKP
jgi:hypothetical protein